MSVKPTQEPKRNSVQYFLPPYEEWESFINRTNLPHGILRPQDTLDGGLYVTTPEGVCSGIFYCKDGLYYLPKSTVMRQQYADNKTGSEYAIVFGPVTVSDYLTIRPFSREQVPFASLTVSNTLDIRRPVHTHTGNIYISLSTQTLSNLIEQHVLPLNTSQVHVEQYKGVVTTTAVSNDNKTSQLNEEQYKTICESIGLVVDFLSGEVRGNLGNTSFNLPQIDVSKLDPDSVFKILKDEDPEHPMLFPYPMVERVTT